MNLLKSVIATILISLSSHANECAVIEQVCIEALRSADAVIAEHIKKQVLLKNELEGVLAENKKLSELADLDTYQPWYLQRQNIFFIGIVTGLAVSYALPSK